MTSMLPWACIVVLLHLGDGLPLDGIVKWEIKNYCFLSKMNNMNNADKLPCTYQPMSPTWLVKNIWFTLVSPTMIG